MNVLVTAGNTRAPIDRVRCVTNVFSGRTGARIAATAFDRGHHVALLTSAPGALSDIPAERPRQAPGWVVHPYATFDELRSLMAALIPGGGFDVVIHAAAVSDFLVAGAFDSPGGQALELAGKLKSTREELWLRLTRAPKLVDMIRRDWLFTGILVKFKLEVGVSDEELLAVAERSRVESGADLMCANTLEGMAESAYLGAGPGGYRKVRREDLAVCLLDAIGQQVHAGRLTCPSLP